MLLSVGGASVDSSMTSQRAQELLQGPSGSSVAVSVCGEHDIKDVMLVRIPDEDMGEGWLYPMPEKFDVL